jgi:hypothetical protein
MKRLFSLAAALLASVFILCLGVSYVLAQVGVGIAPGIINIDEPLPPGSYSKLPAIQVVNTGTEAGQYEVVISSSASQKQLKPTEDFMSFNPRSFHLEPGASQTVVATLDIPARAKPGDYLAYIQAHPVSQAAGGTSVGVAVATKVYFTVKPANIMVGIAYSIASFFTRNAPVSYIVPGIIVLGIIVYFLRRSIRFEIKVGHR